MSKGKQQEKKQPTWCQQLDKAKAQLKNPRLPKQPQKTDPEPPKGAA